MSWRQLFGFGGTYLVPSSAKTRSPLFSGRHVTRKRHFSEWAGSFLAYSKDSSSASRTIRLLSLPRLWRGRGPRGYVCNLGGRNAGLDIRQSLALAKSLAPASFAESRFLVGCRRGVSFSRGGDSSRSCARHSDSRNRIGLI